VSGAPPGLGEFREGGGGGLVEGPADAGGIEREDAAAGGAVALAVGEIGAGETEERIVVDLPSGEFVDGAAVDLALAVEETEERGVELDGRGGDAAHAGHLVGPAGEDRAGAGGLAGGV